MTKLGKVSVETKSQKIVSREPDSLHRVPI